MREKFKHIAVGERVYRRTKKVAKRVNQSLKDFATDALERHADDKDATTPKPKASKV